MSQNYVRSLPQAMEVIKQMNLSPEWESDYRFAAQDALVRILGRLGWAGWGQIFDLDNSSNRFKIS